MYTYAGLCVAHGNNPANVGLTFTNIVANTPELAGNVTAKPKTPCAPPEPLRPSRPLAPLQTRPYTHGGLPEPPI